MGSQKITIYDIARAAGVSITTVSRALANSGKVKQETYSRIMRIVQKYHFQPNEAARILAESKTKIIGVMVSQIENPFYAHMFIWCERIAEMYGYSTILANSMGNLAYEHKLLDKLAAQQVAAVIQFGGNVDACVSDAEYVAKVTKLMRHTPFVVSGKLDGVRCCRVQINDSTGIRLAVTHLAQLGHRRIALIGGSEREVPAYQKAVEFRRLIDVYGLCRDEDFICIPGSSSDAAGYECMERLIAKGKMPSAIISINDFVAAGLCANADLRGVFAHGRSNRVADQVVEQQLDFQAVAQHHQGAVDADFDGKSLKKLLRYAVAGIIDGFQKADFLITVDVAFFVAANFFNDVAHSRQAVIKAVEAADELVLRESIVLQQKPQTVAVRYCSSDGLRQFVSNHARKLADRVGLAKLLHAYKHAVESAFDSGLFGVCLRKLFRAAAHKVADDEAVADQKKQAKGKGHNPRLVRSNPALDAPLSQICIVLKLKQSVDAVYGLKVGGQSPMFAVFISRHRQENFGYFSGGAGRSVTQNGDRDARVRGG